MDKDGMSRTKFADAQIGMDIADLANSSEQAASVIWASECAERVLHFFESERPYDDRPRAAIKACRDWRRIGTFKMSEVRRIALSAHAAARAAAEGPARFAARSAGHALATVHVPAHSIAAASYAAKAIWANDPQEAVRHVAEERDWQYRRLIDLVDHRQ